MTGDKGPSCHRRRQAWWWAIIEQAFQQHRPPPAPFSAGSGQGKQLPKGTKRSTWSSRPAPSRFPVPDGLVNPDLRQRRQRLEKRLASIRCGTTSFNDTVAAGNVVVHLPLPPGSRVPKGGNVKVTVSKGPRPWLPSRMSLGMKRPAGPSPTMQQAGLSVANVFGPPDKKVFTTDPPSGSQVKRGSVRQTCTPK